MNKFKRYFLKNLLRLLPPEWLFNLRKFYKQNVKLSEWSNLLPDIFIADYDNIVCDPEFKFFSEKLHLDGRILLTVREMWNIYNWVKKTQDVQGDIAELGVFRGGSAKLISEFKQSKILHLFDTFEGMPEIDSSIDSNIKGDMGCSIDDVQKYLDGRTGVIYHQGEFNSSFAGLSDETKFAFVHLDVDIYLSTLEGLKYFYPRLSKGGAIISHDYRCLNCPGVKKAFDEFFCDKPETIIELHDTQALIIKL